MKNIKYHYLKKWKTRLDYLYCILHFVLNILNLPTITLAEKKYMMKSFDEKI